MPMSSRWQVQRQYALFSVIERHSRKKRRTSKVPQQDSEQALQCARLVANGVIEEVEGLVETFRATAVEMFSGSAMKDATRRVAVALYAAGRMGLTGDVVRRAMSPGRGES